MDNYYSGYILPTEKEPPRHKGRKAVPHIQPLSTTANIAMGGTIGGSSNGPVHHHEGKLKVKQHQSQIAQLVKRGELEMMEGHIQGENTNAAEVSAKKGGVTENIRIEKSPQKTKIKQHTSQTAQLVKRGELAMLWETAAGSWEKTYRQKGKSGGGPGYPNQQRSKGGISMALALAGGGMATDSNEPSADYREVTPTAPHQVKITKSAGGGVQDAVTAAGASSAILTSKQAHVRPKTVKTAYAERIKKGELDYLKDKQYGHPFFPSRENSPTQAAVSSSSPPFQFQKSGRTKNNADNFAPEKYHQGPKTLADLQEKRRQERLAFHNRFVAAGAPWDSAENIRREETFVSRPRRAATPVLGGGKGLETASEPPVHRRRAITPPASHATHAPTKRQYGHHNASHDGLITPTLLSTGTGGGGFHIFEQKQPKSSHRVGRAHHPEREYDRLWKILGQPEHSQPVGSQVPVEYNIANSTLEGKARVHPIPLDPETRLYPVCSHYGNHAPPFATLNDLGTNNTSSGWMLDGYYTPSSAMRVAYSPPPPTSRSRHQQTPSNSIFPPSTSASIIEQQQKSAANDKGEVNLSSHQQHFVRHPPPSKTFPLPSTLWNDPTQSPYQQLEEVPSKRNESSKHFMERQPRSMKINETMPVANELSPRRQW